MVYLLLLSNPANSDTMARYILLCLELYTVYIIISQLVVFISKVDVNDSLEQHKQTKCNIVGKHNPRWRTKWLGYVIDHSHAIYSIIFTCKLLFGVLNQVLRLSIIIYNIYLVPFSYT